MSRLFTNVVIKMTNASVFVMASAAVASQQIHVLSQLAP